MTEKSIPQESISKEEIVRNIALNRLITQALFTLDGKTGGDEGVNYKPLYYGLFNGISAIIENALTYEQTIEALKQLQLKAEDFYIESA
jgi:hypothetical protein